MYVRYVCMYVGCVLYVCSVIHDCYVMYVRYARRVCYIMDERCVCVRVMNVCV